MLTCNKFCSREKKSHDQLELLTNAFLHLVYKSLSVVSYVPKSLLDQLGGLGKLVDGCDPEQVAGHHLQRRRGQERERTVGEERGRGQ